MRRLFLYLLIGSVGLSALIGIGVLLFGNFEETEVRVLMTTLTVTVMSIFGLACGAYFESGRGKYLPLAGIILSIAAGLMYFLVIWSPLEQSKTFIKSVLSVTLLASAASLLSLLSLARLDKRFLWTRTAVSICVAVFCAIVLFLMWFEPEGDSDLVYRVLGVLGILIASITVVTPVLHKLSSAGDDLKALDKEIESLKERLGELERKRESLKNS